MWGREHRWLQVEGGGGRPAGGEVVLGEGLSVGRSVGRAVGQILLQRSGGRGFEGLLIEFIGALRPLGLNLSKSDTGNPSSGNSKFFVEFGN